MKDDMEYLGNSLDPSSTTFDGDITAVVKDAYDFLIDSGGQAETFSDFNRIFNSSLYFNSTFDGNFSNTSIFPQSNIIETNISDTSNNTTTIDSTEFDVITAVVSIVLALVILITIIGNVFVIAAIILERNLQNVANYLVASLAVADLFVACLVMPLSALYEISKGWRLGPEVCDIWTSCDVLCCTASILHLVAIAADRYWAVTNVDYIHARTTGRVSLMIFFVWISAIVVSLAPQFGWKDSQYMKRIQEQRCMVSQDIGYQIFATCSTFYVPLLIILILYWKIYQTARKRIHRRRPKQVLTANNNQVKTVKKSNPRLRFRLTANFANHEKSAVSSLGLVEGNSTITVNTVGDTDESSTDKKGIDIVTTTFNDLTKEVTTSPSSEAIVTVSQQVTSAQNKVDEANRTDQDIAITDLATGNLNASPLLVSSSPVYNPNQSKLATATVTNDTPQLTTPASPAEIVTPQHQHPHQQQKQQPPPHPQNEMQKTSENQKHNADAAAHHPPPQKTKSRKETLESKRERKAAKTLAIITGAFVVCWLPFFLTALLLPLCGEKCSLNETISSLFLWLGYFNSTLNPVIYTIFSPEFRQAFKRILCGRSGYYRRGML